VLSAFSILATERDMRATCILSASAAAENPPNSITANKSSKSSDLVFKLKLTSFITKVICKWYYLSQKFIS
jgi:hypothetical protein